MGRFHYNELVSVRLQSDAFLYVISTNAEGHLVCRVASPSLPSMTVIETRPEVIQAYPTKSANFLELFNAPCSAFFCNILLNYWLVYSHIGIQRNT